MLTSGRNPVLQAKGSQSQNSPQHVIDGYECRELLALYTGPLLAGGLETRQIQRLVLWEWKIRIAANLFVVGHLLTVLGPLILCIMQFWYGQGSCFLVWLPLILDKSQDVSCFTEELRKGTTVGHSNELMTWYWCVVCDS